MGDNENKPDGQETTNVIEEPESSDIELSEDIESSDVDSGDTQVDTDPVSKEGVKSEQDKDQDKINQEAVNKKINKLHYEKKLAAEKAEEERRLRLELEEKLKATTERKPPPIPPIPNAMDADFEAKMKARDAIIVQHTRALADKQALDNIQREKAAAEAQAIRQEVEESIKQFDTRTTELKLDKKALVDSQNVVGTYIKGKPALARFLLSDENGPLNVLYLSQNLAELEKISKLSEPAAAAYIATTITKASAELKPKTTNAPPPPTNIRGAKTVNESDPNLEGCVFE